MPSDVETAASLFREAVALHRAGRLADAVEAYAQVVRHDPSHVRGHVNLGAALRALGRLPEALESYDRALALDPDLPELHANRGNALHELSRLEEALAAYDRALALKPDHADARVQRAAVHVQLGNGAMAAGRYESAADNYRAAAASRPDWTDAHNNLGLALVELRHLDEAVASFERAGELSPDFASAPSNRGVALRKLNRLDEAIDSFSQAIALDPGFSDAWVNRAYCRLAQGDFARGWLDYEHRWASAQFVAESASHVTAAVRARLDPSVSVGGLAGGNVLVVGEQGVGDVLMFASALPGLMALADHVTLACDARLERLLSASFPGLTLLPAVPADLSPFDHVLAIGSLGRLFRNRPEDFPGAAYLAVSAEARERWSARLGPPTGRRRIGLSWRGGSARTNSAERSLTPAELAPILTLPDCDVVSLQHRPPPQDIAAIDAQLSRPMQVFPAHEIDDFEDLGALVGALDLVVSVQNSVVHLSGALGAPCLAMVPFNPEWRYLARGEAMPWYGSVRLFRQPQRNDWSPVTARVAKAAAP